MHVVFSARKPAALPILAHPHSSSTLCFPTLPWESLACPPACNGSLRLFHMLSAHTQAVLYQHTQRQKTGAQGAVNHATWQAYSMQGQNPGAGGMPGPVCIEETNGKQT